MDVTIRTATLEDAEALLKIYAYYVKETAISFEWEVPTLAEFMRRITNTLKTYPYLCVLRDGVVVGYCYAEALKGREAYRRSVELSIYLEQTARKCGLGKRLYEALEARLKEMGILNLYACIAWSETEDEYLNHNSPDFHAHLGFQKVGEFHRCGYKFGRWYDILWMEKIIGSHESGRPQAQGKR